MRDAMAAAKKCEESLKVINMGTRLLGFSGELVTYRFPHQLMNQISIVLDGYWYNVVVPST